MGSLQRKWLLWHLGVGVYALLLAGIFLHNSLKRDLDSRLREEALGLARQHASTLIKGLLERPSAITLAEFDVLTQTLSNTPSVASVIYLDSRGRIRWHKDERLIGRPLEDAHPETDAAVAAYASNLPQTRQVKGLQLYEVAVPLASRGKFAGMLSLQVSRQGAEEQLRDSMRRFALSSLPILLAVGLPLYYFFSRTVLGPVLRLQTALDSLTLKNLKLAGEWDEDEIGLLASSMAAFAQRMRASQDEASAADGARRAAEGSWWKAILSSALPEGCRALVLDEENIVLHSSVSPASGKTHLLDVMEGCGQDLLRLISRAMEAPDEAAEGEASTVEGKWRVRALHATAGPGLSRTLVLLFPSKNG